MEGVSEFESEVSQESETIGAQFDLAASQVTNEYMDSISYILHSSLKVSAGVIYCQIIHIRIERKCCFPWPVPLSGLLQYYIDLSQILTCLQSKILSEADIHYHAV